MPPKISREFSTRILQGPITAKHVRVANVPIKDMLGDVQDVLVKKFLNRYYDGDGSIGAAPAKIAEINPHVVKT